LIVNEDKFVYGCACRALSATWCKIDGAQIVQVDQKATGMYSHVIVDQRLSREVMAQYELVLVSRPERTVTR
jgi:hypothetical protein